jgi:UDP-glucose 4-epimerase
MRVLVTGSSGLVGQAVVERLAGEHEIVSLSRGAAPVAGGEHVSADIGRAGLAGELAAAMPRCDAIVHTAAALDPQSPEVVLTNCLGTLELVRLAQFWEVEQLAFTSSISVIGVPDRLPIDENHPVDPPNPYLASKLFGEELLREAASDVLRATSFRLAAPIGPRMPRDRILPAFVGQALAGRPLEVAGKGSRRQDYVHVGDIAALIAAALRAPRSGLFNLARGESISNRELAERCVALLGSSSEIIVGERPDPLDGQAWEVSTAAAREAFAYEPEHRIDEAIIELAESMGR